MNFLKKNLFTVCGLVLLVTMGLCSEAWADGASLMTTAQTKTRNVFDNVKTITFIIGGFGLVGIAYSAIIGKVNLKWFAGLPPQRGKYRSGTVPAFFHWKQAGAKTAAPVRI